MFSTIFNYFQHRWKSAHFTVQTDPLVVSGRDLSLGHTVNVYLPHSEKSLSIISCLVHDNTLHSTPFSSQSQTFPWTVTEMDNIVDGWDQFPSGKAFLLNVALHKIWASWPYVVCAFPWTIQCCKQQLIFPGSIKTGEAQGFGVCSRLRSSQQTLA